MQPAEQVPVVMQQNLVTTSAVNEVPIMHGIVQERVQEPKEVPAMDQPFLRNMAKEKLCTETLGLYRYLPAGRSLGGSDKLVKYDEKGVATIRALWHMTHTAFVSKTLNSHILFYFLIAAAVALSAAACGNIDVNSGKHMATVVSYLTTIQGFMLGSYVTALVGRWWALRSECVGGLWGTIDDMCLLLSSHVCDPSDRPFKQRALRLGLLSHALVYNQARGAEEINDLWKLVDRGLMTEAELCVIQNMSSKSQVVWVWISQLIHGLASKGKVRHPGVMVPQFDVMCAKARASIGLLFTYTDTQLPYVWVHMLSTVVVLVNVAIAFKCGFNLGFVFETYYKTGGSLSWSTIFGEMCHLTLLPFAFHAFLLLGSQLADPFGEDFIDFPGFAYHCSIRDENTCFFESGEQTPGSILQGLPAKE